MALQINQLEPVTFGDIQERPVLTAELKLRLDTMEFKTNSDIENAKKVLASAFPQNEAKILEYLNSESTPLFEVMRLKSYLQGGDKAVEAYDNSFKQVIDKVLDKNV